MTKQKTDKKLWPVLREGMLAFGLVVLGIACAVSGPLSIQAKALVVAAFVGCIFFRLLEDQPTSNSARKDSDDSF